MNDVPVPTTRMRDGRWLGGVCAGLARRWEIPVARVRLAFVLAAPLLGLGVLAYVTAWLILPGEAESGGRRGIVLLAQACGALLGLGALAVAGAAATVFGFGWVVVALAGAALVGALTGWTRLGPAWALLPVGSLVLPSVALAVGGLHVEPSTAPEVFAPRTAGELARAQPLRSGLGLLTVDLRETELPAAGTVPLRIRAGVRRTLIALPHDRCVHVVVDQTGPALPIRLGATLLGEPGLAASNVVVFGRSTRRDIRGAAGPTLTVNFASAGGDLVVRDYPDAIDPDVRPDWPGYPVFVEPRPDTAGLSRAQARRIVAAWRERRRAQQRSKARIDALMGGPCTARKP